MESDNNYKEQRMRVKEASNWIMISLVVALLFYFEVPQTVMEEFVNLLSFGTTTVNY